MSGSIPPELVNLGGLEVLTLSSNQFHGSIPSELGYLGSLRWLDVNDNQLSGALPLQLTDLAALSHFWFHNTSLCEPDDAGFRAWLNGIDDVQSSGIICQEGPGPQVRDRLMLSASATYAPTENLVARTAVYNPSPDSQTYTVTVLLIQNGEVVDIRPPQPITLAGHGTGALTFDFGPQAAGSYVMWAELFDETSLLEKRERVITVLSLEDQSRALLYSDMLKKSAVREFDQGAYLVADTAANALGRLTRQVLSQCLSLILVGVDQIGKLAGLLGEEVDGAVATVGAKLLDLEESYAAAGSKGLRVALRKQIEGYVASERLSVDGKHKEVTSWLKSNAYSWPQSLEQQLFRHNDEILSRVEEVQFACLKTWEYIG